MDFIPVYRLLQELFPQTDDRLLKVTAKEHSKDADAAVEYIVTEVLPRMAGKAKDSYYDDLPRNLSPFAPPAVEVELKDQSFLSRHHNGGNRLAELVIKETADYSTHANNSVSVESLTDVEAAPFYDAVDGINQASEDVDFEVVMDTESQNVLEIRGDTKESQTIEVKKFSTSHPSDANGPNKLCGIAEFEEFIFKGTQKTVETDGSCSNSSCIMPTVTAVNDLCGLQSPGTVDIDAPLWKRSDDGRHSDGSSAEIIDQNTHSVSLPSPELSFKALHISQDNESVALFASNGAVEDIESPLDCTGNTGAEDVEAAVVTSTYGNSGYSDSHETDASPLEMMLTRSEQICSIDLLEQIIDDAKNNKKTLLSAVDLVITMMKEVEVQERAAELAKEESEMGGIELLTKAEELEKMLVHAKEANDMHAGEVYGEKAVLATEVRELESRLRSLSDERDKALSILNEMRKIMESRIAEANEMRIATEKETLEKEDAARASLNKQEAMMEKVVGESKILQEAAEENSRLHNFLIDRGRVVDMLQGEISVICQDVRLLKEKFDAQVPISQSVSSSQTSCLLASSSSSSRRSLSNSLNLNNDEAVEIPEKITEPMSFNFRKRAPQNANLGEDKDRDDRDLDDMGWEFFDKDTDLRGLDGDLNDRSG